MTAGITPEMLDHGLAEELAAASLALAGRFGRGATLWCVARSQSVHRIQESQATLGYHLWASTQRAFHKSVDGFVHPGVRNHPPSGPNPHGGNP
ncbi:MAG TPA: hypothetical protein VHZ33_04825 [Trebonia sp.]|jgi:hypothetical protein|nr:hypothetical protein [Trebonia sp.]